MSIENFVLTYKRAYPARAISEFVSDIVNQYTNHGYAHNTRRKRYSLSISYHGKQNLILRYRSDPLFSEILIRNRFPRTVMYEIIISDIRSSFIFIHLFRLQ